jgi:hypothetical protein
MRRIFAAIAGSLVLASSAVAQSAPGKPAAAPSTEIQIGVYDISVTIGGGTIDGTITLTQHRDSIDVKMHVGEHDTPITRVVRKGAHLEITGGGGGMIVSYGLQFKAETVTGTMNFNGEAGAVSGKRRASGR